MPTREKRVLLTGATGFVGARCVPRLHAAGFAIDAVTSEAVLPPNSAGVRWHHCDLLDTRQCAEAIDRIRPSHLLHLAWIAAPGEFWTSASNLGWLASGIALFDAFYRKGGERALGVGTCAEYRWTDSPSREDVTPADPSTIYGQCKHAAALALAAAASIHGGTASWARLFFPYGPGEHPNRLIPYVIRALLKGEPAECTDGSQVRDFVHVDDVADALVALLAAEVSGTFNVGSGRETRLRDVVMAIAQALQREDLVRLGARATPAGDPAFVVADITRIARETGWHPKITLEKGIASSISYWKAAQAAVREHG